MVFCGFSCYDDAHGNALKYGKGRYREQMAMQSLSGCCRLKNNKIALTYVQMRLSMIQLLFGQVPRCLMYSGFLFTWGDRQSTYRYGAVCEDLPGADSGCGCGAMLAAP